MNLMIYHHHFGTNRPKRCQVSILPPRHKSEASPVAQQLRGVVAGAARVQSAAVTAVAAGEQGAALGPRGYSINNHGK